MIAKAISKPVAIQPEADGIRYLRGAEAKTHQKSIDDRNVKPHIHPINYLFAEIRLITFEFIGFELNYFNQRHRYSLADRRLLDNMYLINVDEALKQQPGEMLLPLDSLRYRYLKRKYKPELNQKQDWIRVTGRGDKECVFVWYEDIDEYGEMTTSK